MLKKILLEQFKMGVTLLSLFKIIFVDCIFKNNDESKYYEPL